MEKKALLIIDVQTGLIEYGMTNSEKFIKNIKRLREKARENLVEIIYVRQKGELGDEIEYGTSGWEIYAEIIPENNEKVFDKVHNSAFRNTGLKEYLYKKGITTLVITGLRTEYCINFTCISALEHGFNVIIPKDCITTCDSGEYTGSQINNFFYNYIWDENDAEVLEIDEINW